MEKPVEAFRPETTNQILLAAVGIGVAVILMVMVLNILVGIRRRDAARVFLSGNGLPGVVFFVSAVAAVLRAISGRPVHTPAYVAFLLILPLVVIFFKEPAERLIRFYSRDSLLHHSHSLRESNRVIPLDGEIARIFSASYLRSRFGRLPTDSFRRLSLYRDDPFLLHALKGDRDYIWCIYAMAAADEEQIDAVFQDLYFERFLIPDELLRLPEEAAGFIRRCIVSGNPAAPGAPAGRGKTLAARAFPEGFGGFALETFFEMFEVLLSFVTNTLSFLRVGGFVLSHAGMMSVVMVLGQIAGGDSINPLVIILGNLFVMGLEGLIVGIQVLRLEFYEIFSRFYDAGGQPFKPVGHPYIAH
jgi:V/A-type H+-transporting ATPase subunit I